MENGTTSTSRAAQTRTPSERVRQLTPTVPNLVFRKQNRRDHNYAIDDVLAALEMVEGVASGGLPPAHVGLHAGPVVFQEGDYFGRTVNLAARIADYARPGEVVVSQDVVDAAHGAPVTFTEIGPVELKGVTGTLRLHTARRDAECTEAGWSLLIGARTAAEARAPPLRWPHAGPRRAAPRQKPEGPAERYRYQRKRWQTGYGRRRTPPVTKRRFSSLDWFASAKPPLLARGAWYRSRGRRFLMRSGPTLSVKVGRNGRGIDRFHGAVAQCTGPPAVTPTPHTTPRFMTGM
jgi:hypothetical protein